MNNIEAVNDVRVAKFGGTSLSDQGRIRHVGEIVSERATDDANQLIVLSAASGVTDLLLSGVRNAVDGEDPSVVIDNFVDIHQKLISEVADPRDIDFLYDHVKDQERAISLHLSVIGDDRSDFAFHRDFIIPQGELIMPFIFASHLRARGLDAVAIDPRELIVTNEQFGQARLKKAKSQKSVEQEILPEFDDGRIVVTGGFTARSETGHTTTLDRGGSDLTASFLARLIDEMPGFRVEDLTYGKQEASHIMSADPRVVFSPLSNSSMNYVEAIGAAGHGAKVMHPRAIQHAAIRGIPVDLRSTGNISEAGTRIDAVGNPEQAVKVIASRNGLVMVSVFGWSMDIPGITSRASENFRKHGIDIQSIIQTPSEQALRFTVGDTEDMEEIVERLRSSLKQEIQEGDVKEVGYLPTAVVGVIGAGVHCPEVQKKIQSGMDLDDRSENHIELTSSPEHTIYVNPQHEDVPGIVRNLHKAIFEE